jgi:hypothetical protein
MLRQENFKFKSILSYISRPCLKNTRKEGRKEGNKGGRKERMKEGRGEGRKKERKKKEKHNKLWLYWVLIFQEKLDVLTPACHPSNSWRPKIGGSISELFHPH